MNDKKENFFRFKLSAFFHDPPLKIENIKYHEKDAKKILDRLEAYIKSEYEKHIISTADVLASGIDRIAFKNEIVPPEYFISPFEDSPKKIVNDNGKIGNLDMLLKAQEEILNDIEGMDSYEKRFFYAWRKFFRTDFYSIPADTRAPNHSIIAHAVRTSAIASSLYTNGTLSFALFTIGPVQDFIKAARKTRDFWAGSYILSYLTWMAIRVVVEKYGPDHIVFPALYEQPLFTLYLREKLDDTDLPSKDDLAIASFPNRFFAILPHDMEVLKEAEEAVRNKWKDILRNGFESIDKNKDKDIDEDFVNSLVEVYGDFIDINWAIVDVPCVNNLKDLHCVEKAAREIQKLFDEKDLEEKEDPYVAKIATTEDLLNALKDKKRAYSNTFLSTVFYSKFYAINEKLLSAVKGYRKFRIDLNKLNELDKSKANRCSVCGDFPAAVKFAKDGKYYDISNKNVVEVEETLCPVCLAKREFYSFLAKEVARVYGSDAENGLSSFFRAFPSTTEISAAHLKEHLIEKIRKDKNLDVKKDRKKDGKMKIMPVPKLRGSEKAEKIELLNTDMAALFDDMEDYGVEDIPQELLRFAREYKEGFVNYYAVLVMDGDKIGEWLSGRKNKTFEELMAKVNGESVALDILRDKIHPMAPSFHEDFSRRLLLFSKRVGDIVKERYGVLVYSGGDDVFAMFPVDDVMEAAHKIRKAFSEYLSSKATMSAGIVVAHRKYPLREVIREAHNAESDAKHNGRDSFCLSILKRSGERVRFCSKWTVDDVEVAPYIMRIVKDAKSGKISRRFFYDFAKLLMEAKAEDGWKDIAKALLSMLSKKKSGEKVIDSSSSNKIASIVDIVDSMSKTDGAKTLISVLNTIAFLSRSGGYEEF